MVLSVWEPWNVESAISSKKRSIWVNGEPSRIDRQMSVPVIAGSDVTYLVSARTVGCQRELKIASVIGKTVWTEGGDIRDVISIGKLVRKNDGPEEVDQILGTMIKYGVHVVSYTHA
jgi:hypothetical protein